MGDLRGSCVRMYLGQSHVAYLCSAGGRDGKGQLRFCSCVLVLTYEGQITKTDTVSLCLATCLMLSCNVYCMLWCAAAPAQALPLVWEPISHVELPVETAEQIQSVAVADAAGALLNELRMAVSSGLKK